MDSQVLIIEADAELSRSMQQALAEVGATAEVMADGNEALSYLRLHKPRVIVLCVELGRLSGYSICNKLKKEPSLASIPLLLTSSQASDETFEQHSKLKTHAEAYLKKPFDLQQFVATMRQLMPLTDASNATSVLMTPFAAAAAAPHALADNAASEAEPAQDVAAATSHQVALHAAQTIDLWLDESAAVRSEAAQETTFSNALETPLVEHREVTRLAPHQSQFAAADVAAPLAAAAVEDVAPPSATATAMPTAAAPSERRDVLAPDVAPPSVARASLGGAEFDNNAASNRQDLRSLRQKVSQLEHLLAQKELEFNDRLLQESSRARESIDLKKKISVLERDMNNHVKNLEQTRAQAAQTHQAWQTACAQLQQAQKIQQAQQHNEALLQDDKNRLQQQYTLLQQQHQQLEELQREAAHKLETRRLASLQIGQALQQAAQLLNELPL